MSSACISAAPACGRNSGAVALLGVVGEYRPGSFLNASQNARRGSSWPSGEGSLHAKGHYLFDCPSLSFAVQTLSISNFEAFRMPCFRTSQPEGMYLHRTPDMIISGHQECTGSCPSRRQFPEPPAAWCVGPPDSRSPRPSRPTGSCPSCSAASIRGRRPGAASARPIWRVPSHPRCSG